MVVRKAAYEIEAMQPEQLKRTLTTLHQELAGDQTVDPELQTLLATLDDDIQKLLTAGTQPTETHGVVDAAEALAARFAAEHPRLEALVRELVASLAKMGI
jgi:ubiquinone biosynthesis protein UbiJ